MKTEHRHPLDWSPWVLAPAWLLLLFPLLLGWPLRGAQAMPLAEVTRGSLLLRDAGGEQSAPVLETEVRMQVSGLLARVRVRQVFRHPGSSWAEAVYVFPLPGEAAVDRMRLRIGERLIEGEIQERQAARKQYVQAREEGRRAALVEQERPNVFTTSVANVAPGERVEVEIEYQQTLRYADGEFRLRFPLVVGPRYIPGTILVGEETTTTFEGSGWALPTDAVPDAARISPPVRQPGTGILNPVRIAIELDAGFPLGEVRSSYHAIRQQVQDPRRVHIELAEGAVPADRDFELVWRPLPGSEPTAAWFHQVMGEHHYGMLLVMPPPAGAITPPPRDLIFVIDTSGSMHGDSIEQARQALVLALGRLGPQDRFNIIRFNEESHALFAEPQAASPERVRQAQAHVRGLQAEGGTELLPALRLALAQGGAREALRQILFLTDGSVGNEAQLFQAIRAGLGDSRLFTVGIGSAPNSHFMRQAATQGRGTFTYIGDTREVTEKMQALLHKLEQPALTDIRLQVEGDVPLEQYPAPIPDLYPGEPLLLVMRGARLPEGIRMSGQLGSRPWQTRLALGQGGGDAGIATEWARRRIEALEGRRQRADDPAEREALRQAAIDTALEHRLVSAHTSLVAVDRTPARSRDQWLERHALATNLPHGWDHARVFGSPQTATPARLQGIAGLVLVLAGLLAWRLRPVPGSPG